MDNQETLGNIESTRHRTTQRHLVTLSPQDSRRRQTQQKTQHGKIKR